MKQKFVGCYQIGVENVDLFVREGMGGEFYGCPEDSKCARIKVGLDNATWSGAVMILLHEAFEFAMERMRVRFTNSSNSSRDNGGYLFVFTHAQFTHLCADASDFVADCLPDLAKAYKSWKKENPDA